MDRHDIVAAVKRGRTNLVQLALANGLSRSALHFALLKPSRQAEQVLIEFLGKPAHKVFPDRYDHTGNRTVRRGRPISNKQVSRRVGAAR